MQIIFGEHFPTSKCVGTEGKGVHYTKESGFPSQKQSRC